MLYLENTFLFAFGIFCFVIFRLNATNVAFTAMINKYSQRTPIQRFETRSIVECITLCEMDETCTGTNYNTENLECELQEQMQFEDFVSQQNWTVYAGESSFCNWEYFNEAYYCLFTEPANWNSAAVNCVSLGAELVDIHSADENAFLYSLTSSNAIPHSWIGLTDFAEPGNFVWSSGRPVTYTAFMDGLSSNVPSLGCIFNSGATGNVWQDVPCNYKIAYVCEKPTI